MSWNLIPWVTLAVLAGVLYAANRFMKPFFWRITLCLVPLFLGVLAVAHATYLYVNGLGGFKLGVDLIGGTDLIYEVDPNKTPADFKPEKLAEALKRRIDPTDLYNVTIRPVSNTRVEIILPTGGLQQAEAKKKAWAELLSKVEDAWSKVSNADLEKIQRGDSQSLIALVNKQAGAPEKEVEDFVKKNYKLAERRDLTAERVQEIKDLISQVGSLEFRILAN